LALSADEVNDPRVVAIGASAGGLIAFQELIENLPTDTGMAFVLLSHIMRGQKSLLAEILGRSTKMQVTQAEDRMKVVANHIYVLPSDKLMEIKDGSLHMVPRPIFGKNTAIDHFLCSLAEDRALGSIGIILSGEGSDGAEGIKILKEYAGGITMAQQPWTAGSKSMPINAIQIDHVDHVLTPKGIAQKLASISWCDTNIQKTPLRILWKEIRPSGN
jgi:two-component system, chemotaxis family, CheB/CheR fusion protein